MIRPILASAILLSAAPAFAQPDDWTYRDRRDGVHLRVLTDYELPATETSREPIVVIGGSAAIDGRAEDGVVVIGGTLRLGPTAMVRGDVVAIGGEAIIDPAAQVSGDVNQTIVMGPDWDLAGLGWLSNGWWAAFAFGATLLRLGIVLTVAMLLNLVLPDWVNSIARRVSSAPATSAAVGVAGQLLFVPGLIAVTVALVVSIVGLLLLAAFPLLLGAGALVWVAGYAAVATTVGARLRGGDAGVSPAPMLDLLVGFGLISSLTLIAHAVAMGSGAGPLLWMLRGAGWLIEWTAWTVGLGAAVAVAVGGRAHAAARPAIPYAAAAPTIS